MRRVLPQAGDQRCFVIQLFDRTHCSLAWKTISFLAFVPAIVMGAVPYESHEIQSGSTDVVTCPYGTCAVFFGGDTYFWETSPTIQQVGVSTESTGRDGSVGGAFLPDESAVFMGAGSVVKMFDMTTFQMIKSFSGDTWLDSVAVNGDGTEVYSRGGFFDIATGNAVDLPNWPAHRHQYNGGWKVSPDGTWMVVSGYYQDSTFVYDMQSKTVICSVSGDSQEVDISRDSSFFIMHHTVYNKDCTVRGSFSGAGSTILRCRISPDMRWAATVTRFENVKVSTWRLDNFQLIDQWSHDISTEVTNGMGITGDGKMVISTTRNTSPGRAYFWKLNTCAENQFADYANQFQCSSCPSGKTSLAGSASPDDCTVATCTRGYYLSVTSGTCVACEHGYFKEVAGAQNCTSCPALMTTTVTAAFSHLNCSCVAGYTLKEGGTNCTACLEGTFKAAAEDSDCSDCPVGKFTNVSASTACTKCSPGTFSAASGATVCWDCLAGKYSAAVGAVSPSVCVSCPASMTTFGNASSSIQECVCDSDLGFVETEGGDLNCTCNKGWESFDGNSCHKCKSGTFKDTIGFYACRDCPSSNNSPLGSTSPRNCSSDTPVSSCTVTRAVSDVLRTTSMTGEPYPRGAAHSIATIVTHYLKDQADRLHVLESLWERCLLEKRNLTHFCWNFGTEQEPVHECFDSQGQCLN